MGKYKNHIGSLDKWSQKKHFSHEVGSGKGDTRREFSIESEENYKSNTFWDNCSFSKNKKLK